MATNNSQQAPSNEDSLSNHASISTSTGGPVIDASDFITPSIHRHELDATIQPGSSSYGLMYFQDHHEDRLMGLFAGVASFHPQHAHQAYHEHMISTQDIMLLGIGAHFDNEPNQTARPAMLEVDGESTW
ncbi:hypothetical protein NPX13_g7307 [Xylaria arbuscula]|uniref:Uncharacterized protein n=1 Tax=Xylaria arbuscula TaxID=114810 RepID=A0A9W8TJL4_9PEZI|nr:hypothetical protein NPX13_g7307 [Xylaria arbuscula]